MRSLSGISMKTEFAFSTSPNLEYPTIIVLHVTVFLSGISSNSLQASANEAKLEDVGMEVFVDYQVV